MQATAFCDHCGAANQSPAVYCHACGRSMQASKPSSYNSATGQLLPNSTLKQRYRILAPIGQGGMGAVYLAEDTQLGRRQVALKEMSQGTLSPQEQQAAAAGFKQEALMLAHLHHPNLPSIFDHFEENGRWYLIMSFIAGETLADYVSHAPGGKLSLKEVLQIGIQLCTVLHYLHSQQPAIIFRDLKPENIMRTPDGHIYLIDFGIARHFKAGQARDTVYYGSMGYAPPEQYGRAQTTPRTDIYSLGATLHYLLSGHSPSATPFRIPPIQSLLPTIPTELAELITQMLALDEEKRPTSALAVKQKLEALTTSAPLVSPPSAKVPTPVAAAARPAANGIWTFGKKHLIATPLLAICYACCARALDHLLLMMHVSILYEFGLYLGVLLLFSLLVAAHFGPWVGMAVTGIGEYFGGIVIHTVSPVIILILMLAALIAGLPISRPKVSSS